MDADPCVYDCDACPVADAFEDLEDDRENLEAWHLFNRAVNRFTVDAHVAGSVVLKIAGDRDPESFGDLVERLALLYDVVCPPTQPKET